MQMTKVELCFFYKILPYTRLDMISVYRVQSSGSREDMTSTYSLKYIVFVLITFARKNSYIRSTFYMLLLLKFISYYMHQTWLLPIALFKFAHSYWWWCLSFWKYYHSLQLIIWFIVIGLWFYFPYILLYTLYLLYLLYSYSLI